MALGFSSTDCENSESTEPSEPIITVSVVDYAQQLLLRLMREHEEKVPLWSPDRDRVIQYVVEREANDTVVQSKAAFNLSSYTAGAEVTIEEVGVLTMTMVKLL